MVIYKMKVKVDYIAKLEYLTYKPHNIKERGGKRNKK